MESPGRQPQKNIPSCNTYKELVELGKKRGQSGKFGPNHASKSVQRVEKIRVSKFDIPLSEIKKFQPGNKAQKGPEKLITRFSPTSKTKSDQIFTKINQT